MEGFGTYESLLLARGAEWHLVNAWREALPDSTGWDAVLIGGTPLAAYDADRHPFLKAELAFLTRAIAANTPCLGICCGAQLLARASGAEVRPHIAKEIGVYEASRTEAGRTDPILDGFPDRFPVFHWHGDTFDVPPAGLLLAQGDGCRHQAFRLGRIVGLQFHLEVTAAEADRWCAAYAKELAAFGKKRADIVRACRAREAEMLHLAGALVDGFLIASRR